jgi:hypothetical protein
LVKFVVESVLYRLFTCVLVDLFFKNLTVTIPPASKFLSRLKNVGAKFVKLSFKLLDSRVVGHFREIICRLHHDERFTIPESLISSHGSNNHLSDGVEDPAFPVVVVSAHLFAVLGICLKCALFYTTKIGVSDVLVVLYKLTNDLISVTIEKF